MSTNWLNRNSLTALKFRQMDDSDYMGLAGAGDDSMLLNLNDNIMIVGDLSYDPDYQGFQFIIVMNDDESLDSDAFFNLSVDVVNKLGEIPFKESLERLKVSSADRVIELVRRAKLSDHNVEVDEYKAFIHELKVTPRRNTPATQDESVLVRIRSQLSEGASNSSVQ